MSTGGQATGTSPCLVGWAQVSRSEDEPLDAWAEALAATGVAPVAIDSLDVVFCQSWPYDDPAGRLADRVGITPSAHQAYSGMGGDTPLRLLIAAAERIARGESEVCAIVGGEALAQVRTARRAGERVAWSHRAPGPQRFPFDVAFHPAEVAHRLFQAYSTFALRDVARRAHRSLGPDAHRLSTGELFAPMTSVAAANPHAWFPVPRRPADLVEVTADNRMVAFPYTKRLMAVMDVDLAGAVVLASPEAADRLGIGPDGRVHLRGWATASDPDHVAEHDQLWRSPAMAWMFEQALASAGMDLADVDHADLYSCFPSSVSFALDALGIDPDHRTAPFTVTGGLPYAGGAGSSYGLASLAAMADRLVGDPGSSGLVTGVGMHLSKHAACVLSTEPGAPVPPAPDPGPSVRRPIVDIHHGEATVAAYTVHHGREGAATDAVLVLDVEGEAAAERARCYALARDPDVLGAMEAEEWVGHRVVLADGGDGVNLVVGRERS